MSIQRIRVDPSILIAAMLTLALAGCAGQGTTELASPTSNAGAEPRADSNPPRFIDPADASPAPGGNETTRPRLVFHFGGLLLGAAATSNSTPGVQTVPPSTGVFEAPPETRALTFQTGWPNGTGSLRIDVLDAEGRRVYNSHTWHQVGWGDLHVFRVDLNEASVGRRGAGAYTVLFHVNGAIEVDFRAFASLPVTPPS